MGLRCLHIPSGTNGEACLVGGEQAGGGWAIFVYLVPSIACVISLLRSWSVDRALALPPLPQPWCKIMQQEKVALKFWQAEGVLHYNCVDTGELCAMCCAAHACTHPAATEAPGGKGN